MQPYYIKKIRTWPISVAGTTSIEQKNLKHVGRNAPAHDETYKTMCGRSPVDVQLNVHSQRHTLSDRASKKWLLDSISGFKTLDHIAMAASVSADMEANCWPPPYMRPHIFAHINDTKKNPSFVQGT